MTPLEKAERIIALHKTIESLNKRLSEIEWARTHGRKVYIKFWVENPNNKWTPAEGVSYEKSCLVNGDIGDIAAIVLARMSDEVGQKKRQAERELRDLGGAS